MLYIFIGEDDFSLNRALQAIKDDLGEAAVITANTTILEGSGLTLPQLESVCEVVPFLATKRLVVVRGLLSRFGAATGSGRRARKPKPVDEHQRWVDYFQRLSPSTELVLVEDGVANGNPLLRALSPRAEVKLFPRMKDRELSLWVKQRVTGKGGQISPPAVVLMVGLVGSDLWRMASEVDKLLQFTAGRQIEEADARAAVSHTHEAGIFEMIDAVLARQSGVAEGVLQRLFQQGAAPAYIIVMLTRQFRLMVLAREMLKQKKARAEIKRGLRLNSDFALRRTLEQAGRYSWEQLVAVYRLLLETDLAIKTGRYDGELALQLLVAELCQGSAVPLV